jgi:hypothetical protein
MESVKDGFENFSLSDYANGGCHLWKERTPGKMFGGQD